jgi:hypothetical protein
VAEQALTRRPEDFPQAVHESLAALRAIAKAAKSKDDPLLRKCTPDEYALALLQRKPHHCTGKSSRTGLPCRQPHLPHLTICKTHGGSLKAVKRASARSLAEVAPKLLESMAYIATNQRENLNAAVRAGSDLLDRAGIGALVQAKVRASKQQQSSGAQVVVNIGFLG